MDPTTVMLAVADTKYVQGINDLQESSVPFHFFPAEQAFNTAWMTDAHFVCYYPINNRQDRFPRLNKPVLPKMRHMGADIVTRIFAFDYDTPGHQPWDQDSLNTFWHLLAAAAEKWPLSNQWSLLYTTKAGARLVYFLDEPIRVDVAEGKHRWMVKQFYDCGLSLDKLSDWTRLFRCPYVVRDGKPTWLPNPIYFIPRWTNRIIQEEMPSVSPDMAQDEYAEIRPFTDPKPTDLLDFLDEVSANGRRCQSYWYREAKKRLRGRESWETLFNNAPLAPVGERDTTLHKYVGQVISLMFRVPGTTPTHIYALFVPTVEQLRPDSQTRDWTDCLWSHIGRLWAREDAKFRAEQEVATQTAANVVELIDRVVEGMKSWCGHPALRADQQIARQYAMQHAVAMVAGRCYVLGENGLYDSLQLSQSEVIPRIRALGLDQIVEVKQINQEATGFRDLNVQNVLNKHATVVAEVRGVPQIPGGYIENIDTDAAVLVVPSYCRNPYLTPEWSKDVDEWLQKLGGDKYLEVCEWLGWALDFESGPICAAAFIGDSGSGKKMLARGLAECLLRPKIATTDDLVKDHQYGLLHTPFLMVDEGWPQGNGRGRHPADQFRALVSGQSFECNRKFLAPVEVNNPVRVIFTANNLNVIQMLTANRDLSPQDREALAVRLKHFAVGAEPSMWLRQKGGLSFTGREGHRWIAGDGNVGSDFIVARHFLWLYEHREKPIGANRFLVEGDMAQDIMFEMRTQTGNSPIVIEALIKLLNQNSQIEGLVIQDHCLFVLNHTVLEYFRNSMQNGREKLTANIISQVFRGLMVREHAHPITLRDRPHLSKRRWYELDPVLLLQYARRDGWTCSKLEKLVAERENIYGIPAGV